MFHELFLTYLELLKRGRPWRSSFWLTPTHRAVARGLAACADVCVTNCDLYSSLLRGWLGDAARVPVVPVFSNVGEPQRRLEFARRPPLAVVFGSAQRRRLLYEHLRDLLPILRFADVETLIDIGPPIAGLPMTLAKMRINAFGVLPAEEVSGWLGRSRLGLLHYPIAKLTKSGVFAAMAAHGTAPVISKQAGNECLPSELRPREHYLLSEQASTADGVHSQLFETISSNIRSWSDRHNSACVIERFNMALKNLAWEGNRA